MKYYCIKQHDITDKDGEKSNIKVGMITEVHVITGTQSIISWLLDKPNFI